MGYSVYILFSLRDSKLYIGSTTDIARRLADHNRGKVKSTKHRRPFELAYYEKFKLKSDALIRERELKGIGMRDFKRELRHSGLLGQFLALDLIKD
jgi:putative endonuclease